MNVKTAKRLVELRKSLNLSQEELAEKIGVSRQTVSKWERSESSPDIDSLMELSKLYDTDIDDILGIKEDVILENEKAKKERDMANKQTGWALIGTMISLAAFFVLGLVYGLWVISWISFLIIPIFYYIPFMIKKDR